MTTPDLATIYRAYITCLNRRDWGELARFVHDDVVHNGRDLGIDGYRAMLNESYQAIPDLRCEIELLIVDPPRVATRLRYDVAPPADFLGLAVNGRRVQFTENVFYEFDDARIRQVWSVIDKVAIEAQL